MSEPTVLLTGAQGQLGSTFSNFFERSELSKKYKLEAVDIENIDLTNEESIISALSFHDPSTIINCGAYTSVDKAEEEYELASKINNSAIATIAKWEKENGCRVVHISTDFVFDGYKKTPYKPDDITNPLGVYGETKLNGERHILNLLPKKGIIVRTSWLYSEFGQNFVKTMLNLMSEREELNIVDDQIGSPTSAHSLTKILFKIIENKKATGIFHWCDGASISWYDFAIEIQRQAVDQGLLVKKIPIRKISTKNYPTAAERPAYSVLDCETMRNEFNVKEVDWRQELNEVITVIARRVEKL